MSFLLSKGIAAALLGASIATASCGGNAITSASPPDPGEHLTVRMTTAHFLILADRAAPLVLQRVADVLESAYPRITSDLRVAGLPQTTVLVFGTSAASDAYFQAIYGVDLHVGGFVTRDPHTFVVNGSRGGPDYVARGAVHEFAHVVTFAANPARPGRPTWIWESVAQYECGFFVDPTTIEYLKNGDYPTLSTLDVSVDQPNGDLIYGLGYVLGEYIVTRWGTSGLLLLIQRTPGTDVSGALGISTAEFESGWYAFLHEKYGLPARSLVAAR